MTFRVDIRSHADITPARRVHFDDGYGGWYIGDGILTVVKYETHVDEREDGEPPLWQFSGPFNNHTIEVQRLRVVAGDDE